MGQDYQTVAHTHTCTPTHGSLSYTYITDFALSASALPQTRSNLSSWSSVWQTYWSQGRVSHSALLSLIVGCNKYKLLLLSFFFFPNMEKNNAGYLEPELTDVQVGEEGERAWLRVIFQLQGLFLGTLGFLNAGCRPHLYNNVSQCVTWKRKKPSEENQRLQRNT